MAVAVHLLPDVVQLRAAAVRRVHLVHHRGHARLFAHLTGQIDLTDMMNTFVQSKSQITNNLLTAIRVVFNACPDFMQSTIMHAAAAPSATLLQTTVPMAGCSLQSREPDPGRGLPADQGADLLVARGPLVRDGVPHIALTIF